MRRQQIATQPLREETIYEDVPELYTEHMPDEGANEHHAGEIEEEIDSAETQITSFFHNRDLFERYCVVDGHSDLQAGTRRSTMDQVEFLTMLRMLGLTDDSHNSPTVDCLRGHRRITRMQAVGIFRAASGADAARESLAQRRVQLKVAAAQDKTQMNVGELDFALYCAATSAIAQELVRRQTPPISNMAREETSNASLVSSTSGLRINKTQVESRRLRRARLQRAIEFSPLKRGVTLEYEAYRNEKRAPFARNRPAQFDSSNAQLASQCESEIDETLRDDAQQSQVLRFLMDRRLFGKYCMVNGMGSCLHGVSAQKTMDLTKFLHMLDEVGAMKAGNVGREAYENISAPAGNRCREHGTEKEMPEGHNRRIPAIEGAEGLQPSPLTKKQAIQCYRAAVAQAKGQAQIAKGELNYELYMIAVTFVSNVYVHGEPQVSHEVRTGPNGRLSCPPAIPVLPAVDHISEVYHKILAELPRPRPNGEDSLLDETEALLLDPQLFQKYCAIEGHSDLQSSARRNTMDQYEWLHLLADLGLMPAEFLRENKIVDPFELIQHKKRLQQKHHKKRSQPKHQSLITRLNLLSKEDAMAIFRRALGLTQKKSAIANGELGFRRYCDAAQLAARRLVHDEDLKPEPAPPSNATRILKQKQKRSHRHKNTEDLELEWNARFTVPSRSGRNKVAKVSQLRPARDEKEKTQSRTMKVSYTVTNDTQHGSNVSPSTLNASVERALSSECMQLAQCGDRGMLRDEFCARFATKEAFDSAHSFGVNFLTKACDDDKAPSVELRRRALHEAVVESLKNANLIAEFIDRQDVLALLELTSVELEIEQEEAQKMTESLNLQNRWQRSVKFGGHEDGDVRETRLFSSALPPDFTDLSVLNGNTTSVEEQSGAKRLDDKDCWPAGKGSSAGGREEDGGAESAGYWVLRAGKKEWVAKPSVDSAEKESYAAILADLPRPRKLGEFPLMDELDKLLLDPVLFEKYCLVDGHSSLQKGARSTQMDQHEWLKCLSDLGLIRADAKIKAAAQPFQSQHPTVGLKLECTLSKAQAISAFRAALTKSDDELNFRRYCAAVQAAVKLLGKNQSSGASSSLLWPFKMFRDCFDRIAKEIDIKVLENFLDSHHGWCCIQRTAEDGNIPSLGDTLGGAKRQLLRTPWTQEHPQAAVRPRTSVRKLVMQQKKRRIQHLQREADKRASHLMRLQAHAAETRRQAEIEHIKESKMQRWREALVAVEAKMQEIEEEGELRLQQGEKPMTIKTSPAAEKALQINGELVREGEHTLNQDGERAIAEDEREVPAYTRLPALMKKSSLAARLGFANLSV